MSKWKITNIVGMDLPFTNADGMSIMLFSGTSIDTEKKSTVELLLDLDPFGECVIIEEVFEEKVNWKKEGF